MGQSVIVEGAKTFLNGEAARIEAHRRVKMKSGSTTSPPQVVYADAGEDAIGLTQTYADAGDQVSVMPLTKTGTFWGEAKTSFARFATLYGADDGMVDDAASGTPFFIALDAATALNDIVEMILNPVLSTTGATVSIADAGLFTDETTVEGATQEIYQHIASDQAFKELPMGGWTEQDGTALAAWSDATTNTPGWSAGDEGFGIRWNDAAAPDPISTSVPIPPDLDASADVIVHVFAAKVGATIGDAVTWLIEAFNAVDTALYDADADFGGTSSAMTGDATSKTCQEETLTLASANVAGSPCVLTLTLQPTDGTLGTDDVIVFGVWLEYTRKLLTS